MMQGLAGVLVLACCLLGGTACFEAKTQSDSVEPVVVALSKPPTKGTLSVEEALAARSSVREYTGEALDLEMVSRLLWAAQGQTRQWGGRTAPSAGALFPMEVDVVAGNVEGLEPGVYRYDCDDHSLVLRMEGDRRADVAEAALNQDCLFRAPAVFALSAVYERTKKKYSDRGIRYAHIETGAVCENIYLQAESLGLGTVLVGAYYDDDISEVLELAKDETPLALMPIGHPTER
jgi:SagB-type dehydrogenase family enzyme